MKSPKQAQLESLCESIGIEADSVQWHPASNYRKLGWYADDLYLGQAFTDAQAYLLKRAKDENGIKFDFQELAEFREPDEEPDIDLNEEQSKAYDEIMTEINKPSGNYILKGFAGTGKTTVMSEISKRNPDLNIAFTAPTNKAVKVLRNKIHNHTCSTIHQLLNLKIKKKEGMTFLESTHQPQLNSYDAIIIDESSMLSEEIVVNYLYRYVSITNASLIFVGDPKQLPPVNEEESIVFGLNAPSYTLENIIRQAEGNPILENTRRLRQMEVYNQNELLISNDLSDLIGCMNIHQQNFMPMVKYMFMSEEFSRNHDYVRYLAWTNDRVFQVNKGVHNIIYGQTETPYSVGERIMAREPIMDGEIKNAEECIVQDIVSVDNWFGFPAWKLFVYSETGVLAEIHVLKDQAVAEFNRFKNDCISTKNWKDFYTVTESFSDIQHAYAMTVHKSQGSTFDNVIIDIPNILKNSYNQEELMSLLYVAFSRPRYRVFLRG